MGAKILCYLLSLWYFTLRNRVLRGENITITRPRRHESITPLITKTLLAARTTTLVSFSTRLGTRKSWWALSIRTVWNEKPKWSLKMLSVCGFWCVMSDKQLLEGWNMRFSNETLHLHYRHPHCGFIDCTVVDSYIDDWPRRCNSLLIEHGLTSAPTQYRLYGRGSPQPVTII